MKVTRFRLSTLLLLVALAAVALSLGRWKRQQDWYRERFQYHRKEELRWAEAVKTSERVADAWEHPSFDMGGRRGRFFLKNPPPLDPWEVKSVEGWKKETVRRRQQRDDHRAQKEAFRGLLYFGQTDPIARVQARVQKVAFRWLLDFDDLVNPPRPGRGTKRGAAAVPGRVSSTPHR